MNAHQANYKHVYVNFDVNDDGDEQVYLWYDGSIHFEFNKKDFIKMPDDKDINAWGKESLGTAIRDSLELDFSAEDIDMDEHKGKINFRVRFDYNNSYGDQLDQLESFLDDCDELDKAYNPEFQFFPRSSLFTSPPGTISVTSNWKLAPKNSDALRKTISGFSIILL